jgi:hypothetical protein
MQQDYQPGAGCRNQITGDKIASGTKLRQIA